MATIKITSKRPPIAVEVERICECADSQKLAVQRIHNYLVTRFQTWRYKLGDKNTVEAHLQPYAIELAHNCYGGLWEELERIAKKLEKLIIEQQDQRKEKTK